MYVFFLAQARIIYICDYDGVPRAIILVASYGILLFVGSKLESGRRRRRIIWSGKGKRGY